MAWIIVNLNVREGLAEAVSLSWEPCVIKQVPDYENVLFQCRRCHAYGHPTLDCRLPFHALNGRHLCRSDKEMGLEEGDLGLPFTQPLSPQDPGSDPVSDEV